MTDASQRDAGGLRGDMKSSDRLLKESFQLTQSEIDRLKAEVERYKKALERYKERCDCGHNKGGHGSDKFDYCMAGDCMCDGFYSTAQEALTAVEGGENEDESK